MANTKTAKENIKINERNRRRNLHYKTLLKSAIKRAKDAVSSKDDNRANIVFDTLKTIAKIAAKGIISKPTANRKKSTIHKALASSLEGSDLPKRSDDKKSKKAAPKKAAAKKTTKKADASPAKKEDTAPEKVAKENTSTKEEKTEEKAAKTEEKAAKTKTKAAATKTESKEKAAPKAKKATPKAETKAKKPATKTETKKDDAKDAG